MANSARNVTKIRTESGATLEGSPEMVSGSGPHLRQIWRLEADGTRYEAICIFGAIGNGHRPMVLVCVNVAGGGGSDRGPALSTPRWSVNGGGAWYEFAENLPAKTLVEWYVAEKFRLNRVDAFHVTRLLRAALGRDAL